MNFWKLSPVAVLFYLCLSASHCFALAADNLPLEPTTNNGEKWRIGYIEGGPYGAFSLDLGAIVHGLMELGWIEPKKLPSIEVREDAIGLWQWLANNINSDYLQFVENAFYSSHWEEDLRVKNRQRLMDRLQKKQDLDLLLAYGTWAGQDLARGRHNTNSLIMEVTDAVEAGIIKSPTDSGRSCIYADIDPNLHLDQLRLFHDIIGFETMGVVYENSEAGKSICALQSIRDAARERGFQIVPCFAEFSDLTQEQTERNVAACYEKLAREVDAIYVAYHPGVSPRNMPNIVQPLLENKIPSFTQGTSQEVQRGILFSTSMGNYNFAGRNQAKVIAQVFNGANPGDLQQVFRNPLILSINLQTARTIGYTPSINILSTADEIYQTIKQNDQETRSAAVWTGLTIQ